jgi:hypothetical protein
MPQLIEAYPSLFDTKEMEEHLQQKKVEMDVARIKAFAANHNANYKREV